MEPCRGSDPGPNPGVDAPEGNPKGFPFLFYALVFPFFFACCFFLPFLSFLPSRFYCFLPVFVCLPVFFRPSGRSDRDLFLSVLFRPDEDPDFSAEDIGRRLSEFRHFFR